MSHRGYAAVGLSDVLSQASVPKGSSYHYFSAKDAFGATMMRQSVDDLQGGCLFVTLGAEVGDLSEAMRDELQSGTAGIVTRLEHAIETGVEDGSIMVSFGARSTGEALLDIWIGASTVAKMNRSGAPLDTARAATGHLLGS